LRRCPDFNWKIEKLKKSSNRTPKYGMNLLKSVLDWQRCHDAVNTERKELFL